jgi:hypothetical protein
MVYRNLYRTKMKILPYTDGIHTKGLTARPILLGLRNSLHHWNQRKISILMVYRTIQRVEMKFGIFPLIQQILTDMAINDVTIAHQTDHEYLPWIWKSLDP